MAKKRPWVRGGVAVGFLLLSIAACVSLVPRPAPPEPTVRGMDLFRARAEAGDAQSAVIVGYLLATGEGTAPDLASARVWFQRSADLGHPVGRLNLSVLHFIDGGPEHDVAAARREFRRARPSLRTLGLGHLTQVEDLVAHVCHVEPVQDRGRDVFETFCSGCHGASGVAAFGDAPSFALGERLEKPTEELLSTVSGGHAGMPRWDDKLPDAWLSEAVAYARSLRAEFAHGLLTARAAPTTHFRFGPMAEEMPVASGADRGAGEGRSIRDACALSGGS